MSQVVAELHKNIGMTKWDVKKVKEKLQKLFVRPLPDVVKFSRGQKVPGRNVSPGKRDSSCEEKRSQERKTLSYKIGKEALEKHQKNLQVYMNNQGANFDFSEKHTPLKFQSSATDASPRTYYSIEADPSLKTESKSHTESNDFLLVLNDPNTNDAQVKSMVDHWAINDEKTPKRSRKFERSTLPRYRTKSRSRSCDRHRNDGIDDAVKTVEEIRKSFEAPRSRSFDATPPPIKSPSPMPLYRIRSPSVKDLRLSFENIHAIDNHPESPPKTPIRSSSFYKARHMSGAKRRSLERSTSRLSIISRGSESKLNEAKDHYQRLRVVSPSPSAKCFVPRSASQPDLSDQETFSRKRSGRTRTGDQVIDTLYSTGIDLEGKPPKPDLKSRPKHSRSFLNLVKYCDVSSKRQIFGDDTILKSSSPITAAKVYERKKAVTSPEPNRVIMRTKEMPDINLIRQKLVRKCEERQEELKRITSPTPGISKSKLKHLSRDVGHTKIISKMMELQQCSDAKELDPGTLKLCDLASAEHEYLNVYKSGDVDQKVKRFEGRPRQEEVKKEPSPARSPTGKPFLWSKRFDSRESYTGAQKQAMYKKYFGKEDDETEDKKNFIFRRNKKLFEEKISRTSVFKTRSSSSDRASRPTSRNSDRRLQRRSKSGPDADDISADKTRCLSPLVLMKTEPIYAKIGSTKDAEGRCFKTDCYFFFVNSSCNSPNFFVRFFF